jgi:hypothetical protein
VQRGAEICRGRCKRNAPASAHFTHHISICPCVAVWDSQPMSSFCCTGACFSSLAAFFLSLAFYFRLSSCCRSLKRERLLWTHPGMSRMPTCCTHGRNAFFQINRPSLNRPGPHPCVSIFWWEKSILNIPARALRLENSVATAAPASICAKVLCHVAQYNRNRR